MDLAALEERLGYKFVQRTLIEQAVTHRSHGAVHNERLEFLGDAILNCAVAHLLYSKYGRLNEGDLSRLRSNLVKQSSLADIAEKLVLSEFMRLGEGEMKSGGFRRPSILADTMEAIFGAIFVDQGFDAARTVIGKLFEPVLKTVDPKTLGKDSKTLLQEYLQGKRIALPVYTVVETRGAAHNQEFEVECAIPKLEISVRGSGRSRRAAEQTAAKLAFEAAQHAIAQLGRRSRKKAAAPSERCGASGRFERAGRRRANRCLTLCKLSWRHLRRCVRLAWSRSSDGLMSASRRWSMRWSASTSALHRASRKRRVIVCWAFAQTTMPSTSLSIHPVFNAGTVVR